MGNSSWSSRRRAVRKKWTTSFCCSGDRRSTLVRRRKIFGVCLRNSRISCKSFSASGRSELMATKAAPTSGSQFSDVSTWYLSILPRPGVSTILTPEHFSKDGSSTSTTSTFFWLPGFWASEVNSPIVATSASISRHQNVG